MRTFIITAGGIGKRMGGNTPKQFLMLNNEPVLMHTIRKIYTFDSSAQLIVTLPEEHIAGWNELCKVHQFEIQHTLVSGGQERFHSVQNALAHATGEVIAIHDGVRPFVSIDTLTRLFDAVNTSQAVVPVLPVKESLRKIDSDKNEAVDRSAFVIVQTPQVFHGQLLKDAYQKPFSSSFTDDASVVESSGAAITLVDGNEENIKLTNPSDLLIAQAILNL